ncbi:hypothetical protein [Sulfurimonas sp.]|uniref:hypothetical protein n=1 Tax=Sulfurimonas sp. TaxID=2022749 RepID=UPI0025DFA6AF|nr:hypothetical protein [Sulfurimonas sp.]
MANKEFKNLPRNVSHVDKMKNVTDFLGSLNVSLDSKEKIENYSDYYLFQNLYNSISEIMRNKDLLDDRNIKTNVHTIVSSSSSTNDLAYIAGNLDSVMDSMRSQISFQGTAGDFKKVTETAASWEKANKESTAHVEKLKTIVDTNLKKGFGSRFQLRKLDYATFEENKPQIEILLNSGKSIDDVVTELKIKKNLVEDFSIKLDGKRLNENIESIKEKISENISRVDIAAEYKVTKSRLNKFLTANKLAVNQETIEVVKSA